jgi:transcriptional regulator with XRE-family HTH domain
MKMKKITQNDIAKRLGLSRNAVSRAFNNNPGISPEMKKKYYSQQMKWDILFMKEANIVMSIH